MGYLICENCSGYYELQEDESPEEFGECQCGGKLSYLEILEEDNAIGEIRDDIDEEEDNINKNIKDGVIEEDSVIGENIRDDVVEEDKVVDDVFKEDNLIKEKSDVIDEENIIEIKDLKKSYDNGKIKALNGIDLVVRRGEFISIMGPSGSGKSTLLNMIGALDRADEGSIWVAGIDLMKSRDLSKFRSQKIGFVFQMHNLIPNLNVLENVEIPMFETSLSSKEMRERALELLGAVGLADRVDQNPTKLSGGERQRVAIARALVNKPSIILADEPTGALDSKTGDIILKLLKDLHTKERVTLVMVTHEPYVAQMADRILNVLDGKINEQKKKESDLSVVLEKFKQKV